MCSTLIAVALTGHETFAVICFAIAAILAVIGALVPEARVRAGLLLYLAVAAIAIGLIFTVWPS